MERERWVGSMGEDEPKGFLNVDWNMVLMAERGGGLVRRVYIRKPQ